jgi:hypothetical protein
VEHISTVSILKSNVLTLELLRQFIQPTPSALLPPLPFRFATAWSEPVPERELHALKSSAFHGAMLTRQKRRKFVVRCR